METLKNKRILLTGGNGFLGKYVSTKLRDFSPKIISRPRKADFDLRDVNQVIHCLKTYKPDIIIHMAAVVGGIGANRLFPGSFFYDNAVMGIHLLEEARLFGVEKFVSIATICAYPKHTPIPFKEDDLWNGFPEETNAPYGISKKILLMQSQAYQQQYGFNAITLFPVNLYGPGDNFDPMTSHVIPALIRKVIEAKANKMDHIDAWGTGKASREFLYVEDAAEGICLASDRYNKPDPVNLGSGKEILIKDLIKLICEICEFDGEIIFDPTKPDGQPRRCLDVSRAKEEFGFQAKTNFRDGLVETINSFLATER